MEKSVENIFADAIVNSLSEENLISKDYSKLDLENVKSFIKDKMSKFVKEYWWYLKPLKLQEQVKLFCKTITEGTDKISVCIYKHIPEYFWNRIGVKAIAVDVIEDLLRYTAKEVDDYTMDQMQILRERED